jgi:NTP pyrophosphatase (non-canonical NTP hydrolase)
MLAKPIIHNEEWGQVIDELIDLIYDNETWTPLALNAKLGEEVGELAEHVLVNEQLINKPLNEQIECEVADVINCALAVGIVSLRYMGIDKAHVKMRLYEGMVAKAAKYEKAVSTKL